MGNYVGLVNVIGTMFPREGDKTFYANFVRRDCTDGDDCTGCATLCVTEDDV